MQATYRYDPLDRTQCVTRILRLAGAENSADPVYCDIIPVKLAVDPFDPSDERPQYEAISYTWDGQTLSSDHFIFIRSNSGAAWKLFVTANAHAALRRMRYSAEFRNIWIDSVSIDQNSVDERNFQVRNMGHIYTSADSVLVWLGETISRGAQLSVEYLKKITEIQSEDSPDVGAMQEVFARIRSLSRAERRSEQMHIRRRWSLLEHLFCHPWFSRVWTLQEIALNMSDPVFHYGDETIKLSQIATAMAAMLRHTFEHATVIQEALGSHLALREKLQTWRACWEREDVGKDPFFKFTSHGGARFKLSQILKLSHHMEASNPIDKVYGMHGICQWLDIYLPGPRYDHALEDAFFEVTRTAIEVDDDLSVLYEVDGPKRNRALPSWVPDWANGWKRLYGVPMMRTETLKAGGIRPLFTIVSCERLLKLKGKFIDEINKVGLEK